MKVKDLITKLSEYDPDTIVSIDNGSNTSCRDIDSIHVTKVGRISGSIGYVFASALDLQESEHYGMLNEVVVLS